MALPIFQTDIRQLSMMQTRWASELNPLLANPINNASILKGVSLVTGVNVINHKLGRILQGWVITDRDSGATIYRSAPKNDLTLTLTSSGAAVVDIMVF